jgi:LmbE family N-acetylglucosaminyl deacetylase
MSTSDSPGLALMAVFAHPDDEAFGTGGTLAHYGVDPGVRVVLVCATRGEAGEISNPELATPDRLGEVREEELRCACRTLGLDELYLLGYRDSGMAGSADNLDPRSLTMADFDEAVGRIVEVMRRERPDVVVTFDVMGGYGHPDHIAVHYMAKAAFSAAADDCKYADQIAAGLAPHQASKLYYTAIPRRFFHDVIDKLQEMDFDVPERYLERLDGPWGLPEDACTTDIDVREHLGTKQAAINCHATQINPDSIFSLLPPEIMRDLQSRECFQLASSVVGEDSADGQDLFEGLR